MSITPKGPPFAEFRPVQPGPWVIVRWTAAFGLLSGAIELAIFLLKCNLLDPRNYNVSRHFPWMFPVAGLLVIGVPGLLIAMLAALSPRRLSAGLATGILSFPAYLGILFRAPIYTVACLVLAAGLAFQTARFARARTESFDRVLRRVLVVLAGLLVATIVVCYAYEALAERRAMAVRPKGSLGAKNVVILVLDTVRAQSLSLYGYDRETTPNLKRIAARGVRFDRALSTAPWTAPSHASLFTGRLPRELSVSWNRPLNRSHRTLAEELSARGYSTAAFVANTTYCSYETGLNRGFAHYEDYDVSLAEILSCSALVQRTLNVLHHRPALARSLGAGESIGSRRKSASRVHGDFLRWLDRHPHGPLFAFLNDFDAHHPYIPPDPLKLTALGRVAVTPEERRLLRDWWDLDKRALGAREVKLARDAYDQCIASLDRQVGRLFDELDRRGVLRDTILIITADHGEHLGEHGLFGHGCSLYLPEIHVPLIVVAPGIAPEGRVVKDPVSLRDVPATIIDLLGIPGRRMAPFPGQSLAGMWSGAADGGCPVVSQIDAPPESDPNHGRSPSRRGPLTSLIDGHDHLIKNGNGEVEHFNLDVDPDEVHDLGGTKDGQKRLSGRL